MPFTPSHAAIVLPLLRSRYFSATALIIGSMAPDFEYFFTMNDQGVHGHTLTGIFYFDVPITLLLAFVFHRIVKINLIDNLPYLIQRKFYTLKQFHFEKYFRTHWPTFLFSAFLGAVSHLFWDSFTHPNSWVVNHFSVYEAIVPFNGVRYPLYYSLQIASSYIGMAILFFYFLKMKSTEVIEVARPRFFYWLIVIAIVLVILFFRFYWFPDSFNFVRGVISFISALCIALFIAGLIRFNNRKSVKAIS